MSKIFNLILWNGKQVDHIYIFVGNLSKNPEQLISKELWNMINIQNINYTFINKTIYEDDTILRIKEKLVKYCNIDVTIPEIYLFALFNKNINAKIAYNQLIQDNFLELNNDRLDNFLKNIYFSDILKNDEFDSSHFISKIKSLYSYSDFISLKNINFSKKNIVQKSLGIDAFYNKKHIFIANPYKVEKEDESIENELTSIIIQNKKSLFEYGECLNNSIYICLAKDVLNNETMQPYLLKVYYPQLYNNFNVRNLTDITNNKGEILNNQNERLKNLDNIEDKISFLNKINKNFSMKYLSNGIKNIYLTIHPTTSMIIPLETIFKIINTNTNLPFIKYNSGDMENIYRLYTANNISTNGKRVPSLYVNYNNKQVKIKSLAKSLARTKKIGLFILNDINEVFCELSPDGNIEIKIEFIEPASIEQINELIQNTLNIEVLAQINNFTNDIGYKYDLFDNINNDNIEINNINYVFSFEYKKTIDLNKFIGCLSPVFNINNGIISTSDDIINLTYKRVSSFQTMDSINFFITILQRNNVDLNTIKNKVKDNFNLSLPEAVKKVAEWQSQISFQMEQYENKRINVKDNPGFEINIEQKILDIFGSGYNNVLQLSVEHINNIKYLDFLKIYINALIGIITNKVQMSDIKENCFTTKTADIQDDEKLDDNDLDIDDLVKIQKNISEGRVEYIDSDGDDDLLGSDSEFDDDEEEFDFNDLNSPEIAKQQIPRIATPEIEKQQIPRIATPEIEKQQIPRIATPEIEKQQIPRIATPEIEKQQIPRIDTPEIEKQQIPRIATPEIAKQQIPRIDTPEIEKQQIPRIDTPEIAKKQIPRIATPEIVENPISSLLDSSMDSSLGSSLGSSVEGLSNLGESNLGESNLDELKDDKQPKSIKPIGPSPTLDVLSNVSLENIHLDFQEKPSKMTKVALSPESSPESPESSQESSMGGGDEMGVDLTKLSLSGSKNLFVKRLHDRDPKLFLKKKKNNFNSYAKSCPWQYKKVPVILSEEEKKHIDEKDKESGSKSYDEHITYGTGAKKYHYICPRYWCIRDDDGKSRSLNIQQINEGECGGWDAVIPETSKKVPKGKRIFEFTDSRFHREKSNKSSKENPLIYKQLYPSFLSPDKHPDNLCIPCCYGQPTTYGKYTKKYVKNNKGKGEMVFYDNVENKVVKKADIPRITLENSWKPTPEPEFKIDDKGKIDLKNVTGVKQQKPLPSDERIINYETCNQTGENNETKSDEKTLKKKLEMRKTMKSIQLIDEKPLREAFPLNKNQSGYLTLALQKFLNYDNESICYKSRNDFNLKKNNYCLLRLGIDKDVKTSFISCIASVFNDIKQNNFNTKRKMHLKNIIKNTMPIKLLIKHLSNVKLDTFIKLQNGSLIDVFSSTNKNINIEKYKNSTIYKKSIGKKNWRDYMIYIINSFKNFVKYLKNKDSTLNYEYLWDLICEPKSSNGLLFENGINIILLINPKDSQLEKIELICPKNRYSKNIFYPSRPTIILYSENDIYEIVTLQNLHNDNGKSFGLDIKKYFNLPELDKYSPELLKSIKYIKLMLNNQCGLKQSLPNIYNYYENDYLIDIIAILEVLKIPIIKQLINFNTQVIGILINFDNNEFFLPVKPSKILDEYEYEFIEETFNGLEFEKTLEIINNLSQISTNKLLLKVQGLIVDNGLLIGILTITNQFIPVNPIIYDKLRMNPDDEYIILDSKNEIISDYEILMEDGIDMERKIAVKKVELESKFYNVFRNLLKILLKKIENKESKESLLEILNKNTDYISLLEEVNNFIINIMNEFIKFSNIPVQDYDSLNNISTCFNDDEGDCTNNCIYENDSCKLILPSKNLLSGENNFNIYFFRLSDELIRFPKIKEYILQSNIYLSFDKVNYNLNNSEILLLEEILLEEYFENIELKIFNNYANIKNSYDEIEPNNGVSYDLNFEMIDEVNRKETRDETRGETKGETKETKRERNVQKSLFEKDLYSSSIKCINTVAFNKKININKFKEFNMLNKDRFKVIEFFNTAICSFEIMLKVIRLKLNNYIGLNDVKRELSNIISELFVEEKQKKNIKEIFKLSNKLQIYNYIGKYNFETLVFNEIYYLTEFEFILLALHYNIRLMVISRNPLGSINNNAILVDNESENTVVLLMDNYKTYDYKNSEENNFIPNMGLLQHKNSILIDNEILDIDSENILKITNINDYLKKTKEKFLIFKKEETMYNKAEILKSKKKLKTHKTKNKVTLSKSKG